jgi:thioredoxin
MSEQAGSVLELTEENFATAIDDHPFAVIDFWAPWCAPCRAFAPTFAAAAAKHPDVLFAKVNTEEQQTIGAHFNIRSIPTLMIFRSNIIVFAEAGALPASALDQVLTAARELDIEQIKSEIAAKGAATAAQA